MLEKLKHILNTYSDEELRDLGLWVNCEESVKSIIIDEYSIDLVTKNIKFDEK